MDALYRFAATLLRRPLRLGLRFTVEGLDQLPRSGPVLIASNHISYLDPLSLAYAADLAGVRTRFLTKAELFRNPIVGRVLRGLGHIPVDRGKADSGALTAVAAALAAGRCVVVFPEGTISADLEPMAGQSGLARLARETGVPVLTAGVWGTQRVLPPQIGGHPRPPGQAGRKRRLRPGTAVVVVFGETVVVAGNDNPREATDRIMAGVCAALRRARQVYPQGPGPGEDDWWVRPPGSARLRSCRGTVAQALLDAQKDPIQPGGHPRAPGV